MLNFKKILFKILLLSSLSLFQYSFVFAQEYTVTNYSVEDGLPQSTVYSILEDNNGFLWFSSYGGGISKFDGSKFINYSEINGLVSNQVYVIYQDKKENLWVGTRSGISLFDGFTIKNFNTSDGLKNNLIRTITEDSAGIIWVGTYGGGISKFENEKFTSYTYEDGLLSDFVYDIHFDSNNTMWIATKEGYCTFDNIQFTTHLKDELAKSPIRKITSGKDNEIWIGSSSDGVSNIKNNNYKYFNDSMYDISNEISDILIDTQENQVIFSSLNNGLYILKNNKITNFNTDNAGLKTNIILSITKDSGGNIWLGTYGGGASKLSKTPMYTYHREKWIDKHSVRTIYELSSNKMIFGLREGGIKSPISEIDFSFTRGYTINKIYKSKKNELWIATNDNGIFRYINENNIKHYTVSNGLASNKIFCIEETEDNEIWFGTYDAGILIFKDEKFTTLNTLDHFNNSPIFDLLYDGNKMWLALNGEGIYTFQNGYFHSKFKQENGLCSDDIWSIEKDVFGNIWIGSNGGGISMYNGAKFTNFNTKNGLISNNIHTIIFDEANNLWVGTEKGIDKIIFELKDTLGEITYNIYNIEHYGKEDGMFETETNLNASFLDKEGNLWFGTTCGVTKFNPSKKYFNKNAPTIYITNVKLYFQNVNWEKKYNSKIKRWTGLPLDLHLKSDDNHLTFEYSAITSHYSNYAKYKVKLEGFDENWSSEITESSVNYPSLPPGEYTFKVIASNEDGVWSQKPAEFTFSINTPLYKMPIFYIIIVLVLIGIIYLYILRRDRSIRIQNLKLEKSVLERTKELREEKNHVELQNIEIVAQKRELEIKQNELTKKNTQILDSINYAKRLQKSIITSEEKFGQVFKDYFIFFSPKDIVSGDFQWLVETESHIYLAAVDCTGHGVPGAFMSIVCNRLLNNSIAETKFTNSAEMLKHLHEQLLLILEKGIGEDSYVRDGMDIALCIIDKKTNILSFAGAHNPLLLVRNKELITFEADRKSLGFSMNKERERSFNEHHINLQENDQLYLFSDGFSDQFGGPKKQKYFYLNFIKLIEKISKNEMEDQYVELVNEFLNWKGENEQIDDVLVIGIKI